MEYTYVKRVEQRFPCGCHIDEMIDGSYSINYCPKHKAAPDLYEALKGILPELKEYVQEVGDCDHSVGICFCGLFNKIDNIEQALAKAEGK